MLLFILSIIIFIVLDTSCIIYFLLLLCIMFLFTISYSIPCISFYVMRHLYICMDVVLYDWPCYDAGVACCV